MLHHFPFAFHMDPTIVPKQDADLYGVFTATWEKVIYLPCPQASATKALASNHENDGVDKVKPNGHQLQRYGKSPQTGQCALCETMSGSAPKQVSARMLHRTLQAGFGSSDVG